MEDTFNSIKMTLFEGRVDEAETLWNNRAPDFSINVGDTEGFSLMHFAALDINKGAIKWLLNKGANIEAREKNGLTPMHLVATGKIEMIKYLKECGANIEATDNEGRTPMFHAFMAKNVDAVKCLNELGAKIDVYDSSGMKPIFCAVSSNSAVFFENLKTIYSPEIFSDLLKSRAKNGMPLMYMANQLGYTALEEWLKENGADLD